jgi:hypothetical protein
MPYPQVLPQANISQHIQDTILNINNGLYALQQQGITVWMPEEIKFDFIAIDQFQALPVITDEGGTNTVLTTGTDVAVTEGTVTDAPPGDPGWSQQTVHDEAVNTTDSDQTQLAGYDPTAALASGSGSNPNSPSLGLQSFPYPF